MNTVVREKRPRPVPRPTQTTKFFWDSAKQGKLALQYDPTSKQYQFWPRSISVKTGKRNLEGRTVSGKGTIYSYTTTYVPTPGFEDKVPYAIGLIELDEGVRIIGNLINVDPENVQIGMKVKVAFEKLTDDIDYFCFEPA